MSELGVRLADAHTQGETPLQPSVGEIKASASVQALHQGLVQIVPAAMSETNQVQGGGRGQLESSVGAHPGGELLGKFNVAPHVVLQAFDAVMPDHEPELQGSKTPSELDVPVAVIDYGS